MRTEKSRLTKLLLVVRLLEYVSIASYLFISYLDTAIMPRSPIKKYYVMNTTI